MAFPLDSSLINTDHVGFGRLGIRLDFRYQSSQTYRSEYLRLDQAPVNPALLFQLRGPLYSNQLTQWASFLVFSVNLDVIYNAVRRHCGLNRAPSPSMTSIEFRQY